MERYVLWFSDDIDGVATLDDRYIATFDDLESAHYYAFAQRLYLSDGVSEPLELDWIADGRDFEPGSLDCEKALEAWSFFEDVANSLPNQAAQFRALDVKPSGTYDKLFRGNNLPAVAPPGEHYEPEWSEGEIAEIRLILTTGLTLLRSALR
jgi:hypothetical protein